MPLEKDKVNPSKLSTETVSKPFYFECTKNAGSSGWGLAAAVIAGAATAIACYVAANNHQTESASAPPREEPKTNSSVVKPK